MRAPLDDGLLIRLRKAALMLHWIPDLGATIVQADRPQIRVARSGTAVPGVIDLHPCELRRVVVQLAAADDVGLAPLVGADPGLQIRYFTGPATKLGPHGMVRHQVDPTHAVFAFPSLVHPDEMPATPDAAGTAIALDVDHDDDLGVSLVHRSFPTLDAAVEQHVFEMLYDAATACAVDELVTHLAV
jgi:hypothetical protein